LKTGRKQILRLSRALACVIGLILVCGQAMARDIEVLVESRKGIGLIPSAWRGVVYSGGEMPLEGLNWVHIDAGLVATAWREKIGGGGPGWIALDAAIDLARSNGARVLLPIPTRAAPRNEDTWSARVEDTVRRTSDRVDRYEIASHVSVPPDRYLALYESGAWAAYQGYHKAAVGGPGADISSGLVFSLMERCSDRSLPLSFVSWEVTAETGEEAEDSFGRVEGMLDRIGFKDRPSAMVSRWASEDSPNVSSTTLRLLHGLTKANLDGAFADLNQLPWGKTALGIYDRLGQVEIPMLFDPEGDIGGVATLDGDDVRILVWANKRSRANIAVSGMRWGRTYAYARSVVGVKRTQVVEERDLRAEDPVRISVAVSPGSPVFLTLTPKN
jgi:hypothetical protein